MCVCCSGTRRGFVGHGFFFSSQVLHFENVKDVPFGFQTVTSDINKLSSFYSLKLIKRLYVDKTLNPTTVSGLKPLARFNSPHAPHHLAVRCPAVDHALGRHLEPGCCIHAAAPREVTVSNVFRGRCCCQSRSPKQHVPTGSVSKWAFGHIAPEHRTQTGRPFSGEAPEGPSAGLGLGVALQTCLCGFLTRKPKWFNPRSLIQHTRIAVGSDGITCTV